MSDDLFSALEAEADLKNQPSYSAEPCDLCLAATGEYNWGSVCCRARFIASLPYKDLRQGWMARWREVESMAFYSAIEQLVRKLWQAKVEAAHG